MKKNIWKYCIFVLLFCLLFVQYGLFLNKDKDDILNFQNDSESLVTTGIDKINSGFNNDGYNLIQEFNEPILVNENDGAILYIHISKYTQSFIKQEITLEIPKSTPVEITNVTEEGTYYELTIKTPLSQYQKDNIGDAYFVSDGVIWKTIDYEIYKSQVGLQGLLLRLVTNALNSNIQSLYYYFRLIFCIILAIVVMLICKLVDDLYGHTMALCFYWVFLTSPWIIRFAQNLYWAEFTWFVPMLIGLLYCKHKDKNHLFAFMMFCSVFL